MSEVLPYIGAFFIVAIMFIGITILLDVLLFRHFSIKLPKDPLESLVKKDK